MSGFGGWFLQHWFDLVQSVGIVGGLGFTGAALGREARVRRSESLVHLTDMHRQLWLELCRRPELRRVLRPEADLERDPATMDEELFVNLFIVHLSTARELVRGSAAMSPEAVVRDVRAFFGLPIPRAVWERTKGARDAVFVRFVDACLEVSDADGAGD